MDAIQNRSGELWSLLVQHGLADLFGQNETAHVDCPKCKSPRGLKLSLVSGQARCSRCGVEAPILTYLSEMEDAEVCVDADDIVDAEIIQFKPQRSGSDPALPAIRSTETSIAGLDDVCMDEDMEAWKAELMDEPAATPANNETSAPANTPPRRSIFESLIIIFLSLVFLTAGLSAAGLSAFANFQAFSESVANPAQGQIWGWAGVIASVCSFGGFTFFWWHVSGGRRKEGLRALAFALAGAATSTLGTAMFMANNDDARTGAIQAAATARPIVEQQIEDYRRQLEGIPAGVRSVGGLESYLRGVEEAGRTHQKPYRDAQNELGLARRRAELEAKIEAARLSLLGEGGPAILNAEAPARGLPAWFFAVMLEVFSSQGTSIALVALLVLASSRGRERRRTPDSRAAALA